MNTTWALIYIFSNIHHYFNLHYRHSRRALDPGTITLDAIHIEQRDYFVYRKQFKVFFLIFCRDQYFLSCWSSWTWKWITVIMSTIVYPLPSEDTKQNTSNGSENECKFCGKTYSSPASLRTHEKWHTGFTVTKMFRIELFSDIFAGDLKHKCSFCDKKFRNPSEVRRHEMTHTGECFWFCLRHVSGLIFFIIRNLQAKSHTNVRTAKWNLFKRPH